MLARTCALIRYLRLSVGLVLPLSVLSFFNIDTRMLRYIYFLRLTPADTRNDRYDNLSLCGNKQNIKNKNREQLS